MKQPALASLLVPVDFSECSDAALRYACFLAGPFGAAVDVLHVWESPMFSGTSSVMVVHGPGEPSMTVAQYVQGQAAKELEEFVARERATGLALRGSKLSSGDPIDVIVKASASYDLVVMGTHGRGAVAHLLLGSVADRVVHKAHCPVLTLRG